MHVIVPKNVDVLGDEAFAFSSSLMNVYFEGDVPMDFWDLLALYICSNTLSSLPWAIPFGDDEINTMRNQAQEILVWYDNMNTTVPNWYRDGKEF